MDSLSSGYGNSHTNSSVYDNNVLASRTESPHGGRGTPNSNVPEPGTRDENVYHRIDDNDSNGRLNINKERRPLPSVPKDESRQNSTDTRRRTGPWLRIAIVVLGAMSVAAAVVIIIRVTSFRDEPVNPTEIPPENITTTPVPIPEHPCNNNVSWNYSEKWEWSCFVAINDARTMILKTENSESEIYMLDDDEMNVTTRGMVITIKQSDGGVTTYFGIQEVNCSTTGSYNVTLNNPNNTETFIVNVSVNPDTQLCPCTRQTMVQKQGYIQCRTTSSANVSVTFRDETSEFILAHQIPIDEIVKNATSIMDSLQLRATYSNSEAVIRLDFPTVECSHAGSYFITLGNTMFEIVLSVTSHPDKPIIDIYHDELGGLVEGQRGEIQCRANVGCGQSSPSLYEKVVDEYQIVRNTTSSKTTSGSGSSFIVTLEFTEIHMQSTNGTEYMCSYMVDDVLYESDVFVVLVIPGDYCGTLNGCDIRHPYDCTKYITCTTRPLERLCVQGLHFRPSGPCAGQCEHPNEANCHPGS